MQSIGNRSRFHGAIECKHATLNNMEGTILCFILNFTVLNDIYNVTSFKNFKWHDNLSKIYIVRWCEI
jgi:hypothetical protein